MVPPAIKKERSRSKGRKEEKKVKKRNTSSSSSSSSSSERKTKKEISKSNKRKMEKNERKERGVVALENLADSMEGLVSKVTIAMLEMFMQIQMVMLTIGIKVMWTGLSVAVGVAITAFFAFNSK